MTIRELKDRVPYVKGIVKLPSPKGLREADIPVIADTDDSPETCLGEECRAVVYMNGLVLYTRGKYATVFRLHKCRETYGKGSARSFTEVPYQFMLMLEGEHRLEYNQDKKEEDWNTSAELLEEEYGYELPGRGDILDELVTDEIMKFIFSILTERQKMVVYGFTNLVHFTDDGISGTRFDRPGFLAMMREVESGKVGTILIKDMSRMGRDYLKVGQYMELLRQKNVRLIAVNENVDSFREDDDFTPFRNIMNEWYARDTSKKIKSTFKAKGKSGKHVASTTPYQMMEQEGITEELKSRDQMKLRKNIRK